METATYETTHDPIKEVDNKKNPDLKDRFTSTAIAYAAIGTPQLKTSVVTSTKLATSAVTQSSIASNAVTASKLNLTTTTVTIGNGGTSGSATVPANSTLIGWYPTGLNPANGQSYVTISSISLSGTTVTVTTTAAVGAASTVNVITST